MLYIGSDFSLTMLKRGENKLAVKEIPLTLVRTLLNSGPWESAFEHPHLAWLYSKELCLDIGMERAKIALNTHDILIVGQYHGPRLPEGAVEFPEGTTIRWMMVSVEEDVPVMDEAT